MGFDNADRTPVDYAGEIESLLGANDDDWNGTGLFLALYDSTAGDDRNSIIEGMAILLSMPDAMETDVIAKLVVFAQTLDITQLDECVRDLTETPAYSEPVVKLTVDNYIGIRDAMTAGRTQAATIKPAPP